MTEAPRHVRGRFREGGPAIPVPARVRSVTRTRPAARSAAHSAAPAGHTAAYPAAHSAATGRPAPRPPVSPGSRAPGAPGRNPPGDADRRGLRAADGAHAAPDSTSDAAVVRDTGSMAIATLVSRITGFIRTILILAVLGKAVASSFNVANQLPNLIMEVVLGAVLTALVVPVLVRAEKEDDDGGAAFVRRLLTISGTILLVVTAVSLLAAPLLTRLMLGDGKVNVPLATLFAWLLLPQIAFYGLSALFMAILNTKGLFRPGAWAPVWNNLVVLGVFAVYWFLPGDIDPDAPGSLTDPRILVLGIGTTVGVVVQCVVLVPPLRRLGVDLRPLWGLDARIRQFGGMGAAIIVYVIISQVGLVVTNRVAAWADPGGPSIYGTAWLLLQVPYGVLGVTLLTAIMPRMSRNAADDDRQAVVRDLTVGTKLTLLALVPVIVFMTVFGGHIANALFAYGRFSPDDADVLGLTLSYSSFTLIPYALVLLHLRVFYAREEAWTPTFIIIGITATKIVLSYLAPTLTPDPQEVVVLLGAANGFGFVTGAIVGALLLRRSLGPLRSAEVMRTVGWVGLASGLGAGVAWVADRYLGLGAISAALGSPGYLVRVALLGILLLAVTGAVLWKAPVPEVQSIVGRFRRGPGAAGADELTDHGVGGGTYPGSGRPMERRLSMSGGGAADRFESAGAGVSESGGPAMPPIRSFTPRPLRGPRLVPGSVVGGGRYRLLADHGGASGMRFWQARDNHLDREVALTFVDPEQTQVETRGDLVSPAQATLTRTQRLGRLHSVGVARVLDVVRDSSGGIVVAEWTEGSHLRDVAAARPDPRGSAFAVHHLAQATEDAHRAGTPLGIDHPDRIRISADGAAVLAFPGLSVEATEAEDIAGLGRVLYALCCDRWPASPDQEWDAADDGDPAADGDAPRAPSARGRTIGGLAPAAVAADGVVRPAREVRTEIPWEVSEIASRALNRDGGLRTAAAIATMLDQASVLDQATEVISLEVIPDETPEPALPLVDRKEVGGGSRRTLLGISAIVAVIVVAAALVFYWLGSAVRDDTGTVDWKRLDPSPTETTTVPPTAAPPANPFTQAKGLPSGRPEANQQSARLAIDGDPATFWSTGTTGTFGGLLVSLPQARTITTLRIVSDTPGTFVNIYRTATNSPSSVQSGLLTQATLTDGETTVNLSSFGPIEHLVIWPATAGRGGAHLNEIRID